MTPRSLGIPSRVVLLFAVLPILPGQAQETSQSGRQPKAVHLIGLVGVKDNAKGTLNVADGQLHFVHDKTASDISVASIQDVVAGADTAKAVGKTIGTVSMAAPYGGGRFLSLFRKKIDTLTIQYHDADGSLHGVIFTMAPGGADALKKQLVAQGAHVSTIEEADTSKTPSNNTPNKEQKQ